MIMSLPVHTAQALFREGAPVVEVGELQESVAGL
jgi:hypothetical protein